MDAVTTKLEQLASLVESARSMPMSASCVVNRAELLGLIDDLKTALPDALAKAKAVLDGKAAVVEAGRLEAVRIVEQATQDRLVLLSETAVLKDAEAASLRLLAEARATAEAMRLEAEDYVDSKLATFEVVLGKTLAAVERGRNKLAGQVEHDALRAVQEDPDDTPLPG